MREIKVGRDTYEAELLVKLVNKDGGNELIIPLREVNRIGRASFAQWIASEGDDKIKKRRREL